MKRNILCLLVTIVVLQGCLAISPQNFGDCPIKETNQQNALIILHDDLHIHDPTFCYEKLDGTKLQIENQKAIESIRAFTHDPHLFATLKTVQVAANGPNTEEQTAIYTDQEYNVFEIELASYRVTEERSKYTNNSEPPVIADSEKLSIDELRQRAEELMAENTPNFAEVKSQLIYEEAQKLDAVFFFRWGVHPNPKWQLMPPFAQVGFAANGEIVSYVNWLFVTEK